MSYATPAVKVGFHGTTRTAAQEIASTGLFLPSSSKFEWLGTGAYFFEDAPEHARLWAEEHNPGQELAVVRAEIELGNCMDLFDITWGDYLRDVHDMVIKKHRRAGIRLPAQDLTKKRHGMDCAVFNLACSMNDQIGNVIDTVRSPFTEGVRIYPDSAVSDRDHVQICVRQNTAIKSATIFD